MTIPCEECGAEMADEEHFTKDGKCLHCRREENDDQAPDDPQPPLQTTVRLKPRDNAKDYTPEERHAIVRDYLDNKSGTIAETANRYNITQNTLYSWRKKYAKEPLEDEPVTISPSDRTVEELIEDLINHPPPPDLSPVTLVMENWLGRAESLIRAGGVAQTSGFILKRCLKEIWGTLKPLDTDDD